MDESPFGHLMPIVEGTAEVLVDLPDKAIRSHFIRGITLKYRACTTTAAVALEVATRSVRANRFKVGAESIAGEVYEPVLKLDSLLGAECQQKVKSIEIRLHFIHQVHPRARAETRSGRRYRSRVLVRAPEMCFGLILTLTELVETQSDRLGDQSAHVGLGFPSHADARKLRYVGAVRAGTVLLYHGRILTPRPSTTDYAAISPTGKP